MITRIETTPLKDKIVKPDLTLERGWLQSMADFTNATKGYWGKNSVKLSGVSGTIEHNIMQMSGALVTINVKVTNPVFSSAQLEIEDYTCFDGTLSVALIDASKNVTSIDNIYVESNTANIADSSGSEVAIISGTLIKNLGV